jgi:hypothetical protein
VRWFTWNTPIEHISSQVPHPLQKTLSMYTSIRMLGEGEISILADPGVPFVI